MVALSCLFVYSSAISNLLQILMSNNIYKGMIYIFLLNFIMVRRTSLSLANKDVV